MSNFGCEFSVEMIVDADRLKEKLCYWNSVPFVAIDTEFVRVDTFYPIAGLIQVADDQGVYLIDPIEIPDLTILKSLLVGNTIKVMHSMSEDVVLFQQIADCIPENIFDTQIACALLGQGLSVGYQKFIEHYTGVTIDKGETRSDWLKRPLSDSQLEYAAKDVHYLFDIYPRIHEELEKKGFSGVVLEECSLINQGLVETGEDIDNYYLKFRGAWKYSIDRQQVLKQIAKWREREARKLDKPRSRIVSDKQILEIAERMPKSVYALQEAKTLKPAQLRKYGDFLISITAESVKATSELLPIPRPLSGHKLNVYRKLKKASDAIAVEKDVAPELLGRKRLLESFIQSAYAQMKTGGDIELPEAYGHWRIELLSEPFKAVVESSFNEQ